MIKEINILIIIGFVNVMTGYIRTLLLETVADRHPQTIRQTLFKSILKQDLVFFDTYKTGQLHVCMTDNVDKIQDGIGNKLGSAIEMVSTFICCIIIGKFLFRFKTK